jgi:hypothetical protein
MGVTTVHADLCGFLLRRRCAASWDILVHWQLTRMPSSIAGSMKQLVCLRGRSMDVRVEKHLQVLSHCRHRVVCRTPQLHPDGAASCGRH